MKIGILKRILVDGGYFENGAYHFYLQDHLDNNRVAAKADGTVVQTSHYYPYGMAFAESTDADKQPYKYNNKELDTENGLNLYDYEARQMDGAVGRFTSIDPMAEKYYSISPYVYCGNNSTNAFDLHGDTITTVINSTVSNPDGTTRIQSDNYFYDQNGFINYYICRNYEKRNIFNYVIIDFGRML